MPGHHPIHTIGHSISNDSRSSSICCGLETSSWLWIFGACRAREPTRSSTRRRFPETLVPWQIGYRHIRELGGLRSRSESIPPKVNGFWTNPSFHNFADYALSDAFRAGLSNLLEFSETNAARSCVRKRCGGGAIAGSWRTTCWSPAGRSFIDGRRPHRAGGVDPAARPAGLRARLSGRLIGPAPQSRRRANRLSALEPRSLPAYSGRDGGPMRILPTNDDGIHAPGLDHSRRHRSGAFR